MKPFNLAEALNGAPLITRDGRDKNVILRNVIIGAKHPLISEIVNLDGSLSHQSYYLNGKLTKDEEFDKDLFMKEDSDLEEKFTDNSLIITCEKCFNANQNLLYKIQRMEEEIKSLNKKIQQIKIIGENLISVCSKEYMP